MCSSGCCSAAGQCTGNILYVFEKLASFAALTAVVLCIISTVSIALGLGIGLGYNYCFVDLKVMTEESKTSVGALRSRDTGIEDMDYTDQPSYRRSMATTTLPRRTLPLPAIKHTMAIPLNGDFDFPALLSKLRGRNRNVTLELIT